MFYFVIVINFETNQVCWVFIILNVIQLINGMRLPVFFIRQLVLFLMLSGMVQVWAQTSDASNQVSRMEYIQLLEEMINQGREGLVETPYRVKDLVYPNWSEWVKRAENPFLVPAGKFYTFSLERQLHILRNPAIYIMAPDSEFPLRIQMSRGEFEALSIEKRQVLLQDFNVDILD